MRDRRRGFTLVEIMIVLAIIGIIISISVPSFLRARELSRTRACQENQYKIEAAKLQYMLDKSLGPSATPPTWEQLIGGDLYLRWRPTCPGGGIYDLGDLATNPSCTLSADSNFPHLFVGSTPSS